MQWDPTWEIQILQKNNWEYSKSLQKLQNSRLSQSVIQAVEQQVADGWMNVVRRERGGGCPAQFFSLISTINHHLHNYQTSTQNFQLKFIIKWREGQELTRDGAWLIILTGDRWGEQSLIVRIVIRSPRLSLILLSPHQSRPHPETLWRSYNSQLAHTDTLSAHIRFSIINISLTVNSTYRQN